MLRASMAGHSWRTWQWDRSHPATLTSGSSLSFLMPRVSRAASNRAGQLSQAPKYQDSHCSLAPKGLPLYL